MIKAYFNVIPTGFCQSASFNVFAGFGGYVRTVFGLRAIVPRSVCSVGGFVQCLKLVYLQPRDGFDVK
jgi:hypothetical protein